MLTGLAFPGTSMIWTPTLPTLCRRTEDPYEDAKVFLNVDLKSYAVGSLKKAQVRGAVTSLCKAADCANVSSGWRNLYGDDTSNYRCHGLLFVYNHDGDYDGDFEKFFEFMDTKDAPLDASNRVFVFSPATVSYLATVANDLRGSRGTDRLPSKKEYSFYYPDLIGTRPKKQNQAAASIEVLLSPWQILRFTKASEPDGGPRFTISFTIAGTVLRWMSSNICLMRFSGFHLLGDEERISLRMPFAHHEAAGHFDRAKDAYAAEFYGLREFRARLNRITFDPITTIIKRFSTIAIGMERRDPK